MALKSWLASLKTDVSGVSSVSVSGGMVASDTADTAAKNQTYQAKPNIHAGCTPDTAETCKKIDTEAHAANQLLFSLTLFGALTQQATVSKRVFGRRGPWLTERQALDAKAYHLHHFKCPQCIAVGRGERYGRRCAVGLALWNDYTGADSKSPRWRHAAGRVDAVPASYPHPPNSSSTNNN